MNEGNIKRWRRRRQRLLNELGGSGWLVLPTAPEVVRNRDVHYEYRPDSSFAYLTGYEEPGATLVARRLSARRHRAILFVRERDPDRERWDGPRIGTKRAKRIFGVDETYPAATLYEQIEALLRQSEHLFFTLGSHPATESSLSKIFERLKAADHRGSRAHHPEIRDPSPILEEHRLVKDSWEVDSLRRAASITATGHLAAMRAARPGMWEYQVQAVLESAFRSLGSERNGYPSIVASGANACTLHYIANRRKMNRSDLLLIDAGAEWNLYTADVTRTFPVNGRFTEPQREIYDAVLASQKAAIAAVRSGADWLRPHRVAQRVLVSRLKRLGIVEPGTATEERRRLRRYFMHGTSHWLGLDVHDAGAYEIPASSGRVKPRRLEPGMVLTIEPGLYFSPRDASVPKRYRGIGVRIEDDVVVTKGAPLNLTTAIPKEVDELEELCGSR